MARGCGVATLRVRISCSLRCGSKLCHCPCLRLRASARCTMARGQVPLLRSTWLCCQPPLGPLARATTSGIGCLHHEMWWGAGRRSGITHFLTTGTARTISLTGKVLMCNGSPRRGRGSKLSLQVQLHGQRTLLVLLYPSEVMRGLGAQGACQLSDWKTSLQMPGSPKVTAAGGRQEPHDVPVQRAMDQLGQEQQQAALLSYYMHLRAVNFMEMCSQFFGDGDAPAHLKAWPVEAYNASFIVQGLNQVRRSLDPAPRQHYCAAGRPRAGATLRDHCARSAGHGGPNRAGSTGEARSQRRSGSGRITLWASFMHSTRFTGTAL